MHWLLPTIYIHKLAQIVLFVVYLFNKYQLNKDVQNPTILQRRKGSTQACCCNGCNYIGIAQLLYLSYVIFDIALVFITSWLLLSSKCVQWQQPFLHKDKRIVQRVFHKGMTTHACTGTLYNTHTLIIFIHIKAIVSWSICCVCSGWASDCARSWSECLHLIVIWKQLQWKLLFHLC